MAVFRLSFIVALIALTAAACGRSAATPRAAVQRPSKPCAPTGTFQGRSIAVGDLQRFFFLHVPAGYACGTPMPLLVDFHGTTSDLVAEEDLLTEEAVALADRRGFILARPRSLSGPVDGEELFQWDVNDGDLHKNVAFTLALVETIRAEYDVDPARTYALGFSNGTNMAVQFLGRPDSPFRGYAVVGGGAWEETEILPRREQEPRLYAVTGYRDYMHEWHRTLIDKWLAAGYSSETVFVRRNSSGHELYEWHYHEAWEWLDRGRKPPRGQLTGGWEMIPTGTREDLLAVEQVAGNLVVTGANGYLARQTDRGWVAPMATDPAAEAITDLCIRYDGVGLAVGESRYAYTRDGGRTWAIDSSPQEFFGSYLGTSHLLGVACGERLIAGGYWTGVVADEPYGPWEGAAMLDEDDVPEHISDFGLTQDGGAIVVGENWIGRSVDPLWTRFQEVEEPDGWAYGIDHAATMTWWVVGARGELLVSTDDGWNWDVIRESGSGSDLYAIDFADEMHGAAVGADGTVLVTADGGQWWLPVPTGLDHYLGDVIAFADGSVVAVGEDGFVARWRPIAPAL